VIEYITIGTTGNSADFGDLTVGAKRMGSASNLHGALYSSETLPSQLGLIMGGSQYVSAVTYINIASTGNALFHSDLTTKMMWAMGVCSSSTRFVNFAFPNAYVVTLEFNAFSSRGKTSDFGDSTASRFGVAAFGSSTRGCWAGGYDGTNRVDVIDYITIASAGNATDFGNLSQGCAYPGGNVNSTTRGITLGGNNPSNSKLNEIQYVTIASTGNATDFGDLTAGAQYVAGTSNATRGIRFGGLESSEVNKIEYVTIASTGNSQDFGDLSRNESRSSALASTTRAIHAGGNNRNNEIEYITIASTGNSTDFGDLPPTNTDEGGAEDTNGISNCHGGL